MSRFPRLSILIAVPVVALGLCGSAQGAIVTVGSPLTQSFSPAPFNKVNTSFNSTLAEIGAHATSPISGVVVRWRILDAAGGPFKIRVLRPAGGNSYIGVGRTSPETPTGLGLQTFATNLPIQAGDTVGIDNAQESGDQIGLFITSAAASYSYWEPQIPEGIPTAFKATIPGYELAFNVDVQPPPTLNSFSPTSGSIKGGTPVKITGTDFEGASVVSFGGVAARSFTVDSESQITAVAPATTGAVKLPVSVTTIAGTATSSTSFSTTACVVPKLAGKKLKVAKKKLKKAGCKTGKVTKEDGVTAKTGKVVGQSPKPGRTLAPGTKIKITLG